MTNDKLNKALANILQQIGTPKCFKKAAQLNRTSTPITALHLRDLSLNASNVKAILNCIKESDDPNCHLIKSISFSYNPLIGDVGTVFLTANLPNSILEVGLVGCGITDIGGMAILDWMRKADSLQMICMEQNDFSDEMRLGFQEFSATNSQVLVIY